VLLALSVALAALWAKDTNTTQDKRTTVAAAVLGILDCVAFAALSISEHSSSVGPSLLLDFYLLLSVIFDAVRLRTLWLKSVDTTIASLSSASLALKLVILVLEELSKRRWIIDGATSWSNEETAGLFSRTGFCWLNPLLLTGYSATLSVSKLPVIDRTLLSESLWERIGPKWEACECNFFSPDFISTNSINEIVSSHQPRNKAIMRCS
jgi:hypothetical protein